MLIPRPSLLVFLVFTLPVLLVPRSLFAQQFTFRHYGQDEGLRNPDVFSIVQDDTGPLWIATENGLYRYDGSLFQRFGPKDGIEESLVMGLHKDPSGRIWVTTNDHLYYFTGTRFQPVDLGRNPIQFGAGQRLTSIDSRHILYLDRGSLMLLQPADSGTWTAAPYFDAQQLAANPDLTHLHSVFVSPIDHTLWLGCGHAICHVRPGPNKGHIETFSQPQNLPDESWVRLFLDSHGTLWARGMQHIRALPSGETNFRSRDLSATGDSAYTGAGLLVFSEDPSGRILTQTGNGIARWNGAAWQIFDPSNGITFKDVSTILFDLLGSLWFGTRGHGIVRWQGYGEIESWTVAQGLQNEVVWPIYRDHQQRLWIADQAQLSLFDQAAKHLQAPPALAKNPLSSIDGITQSPSGSLWVVDTAGEVVRLDAQVQHITFSTRIPNTARLFADSSHRIWFLTREGLYVVREPDAPKPTVEKLTDLLISTDAFADAAETPDHTLWFASDNHLYHLVGSTFTEVPLDSHDTRGQIRNIAAEKDGSLWIGGGLPSLLHLRVQNNLVTLLAAVSTPDILSTDVQFVRFDTRGWLWVGTDLGVNVYDGSRWRLLTQRDGLLSNDTDESSFFADTDGSVWIGVNGGAIHLLHPQDLFPTTPLTVNLTNASLGKQPLALSGGRNVWRWHDAPLDVAFTSLNFNRSDSLIFQYRLLGLEPDWLQTTSHALHYPALPPGTYTFQLQAIDPDQQKQSTIASFTFTVRPPWWRTQIFYVLIAFLTFGLSVLIWRWRERRLIYQKKILSHLVAQRTRELEAEKAELLATREALRRQATQDALTGLMNRAAILEVLDRELERARREQSNLALVLADIDHFKQINDTYGHFAGDAVLRETATRMLQNIRPYDFLGRYGGEEFLIILPGIHPSPETRLTSSRADTPHFRLHQLQQAISATPFFYEGTAIHVTSSFGAVWMYPTAISAETLLRRADEALYRAKATGRNRIVFHGEPEPKPTPTPTPRRDDQLTS